MNKIRKALPLSISLFAVAPLFCSCGSSSQYKTSLVYGSYVTNEIQEIKLHGDLANKFENKETFIVSVYEGESCICWRDFQRILKQYNEKYHTLMYKIKASQFDSNSNKFGIDVRSTGETFVIVEDGKIKEQIVYKESDKRFKNYDAFLNWFEAKITLPTIFFISKTQLDEKYLSNKPFVVEFGRESCPDCRYVNTHALKDYSKSNRNMKEIYYFDVDEVRLNSDGEVDSSKWQEFKDNYGLSSLNNETFGYDSGYVPTFFYVEPDGSGNKINTIKSGSVSFNDEINKIDGKYVITSSYYTENRKTQLRYLDNLDITSTLLGLEIPSEDLNIFEEESYYSWKHEASEKYHTPLLNAFLDAYSK